VFIYGEGWTSGGSPLPDSLRALKAHTGKLDRVAAFSDDMRDGLKGSVFEHSDRGFVSGKPGLEETIKFGIVAATQHPEVDYSKVNYSKAPWAGQPGQCINYASCHDNHSLWDKLSIACPTAAETDRIRMQKLALGIVLSAQGVPFLDAGVEMCRSKQGVENSFNAPDSINQIDWRRKSQYQEVYEYVKALIQLRKNHPAFRMPTAEMIRRNLQFLPVSDSQELVVYRINHGANGDRWQNILVLLNGSAKATNYPLPAGTWTVVADENSVDEQGLRVLRGTKVTVPGTSLMILMAE
jgi:pullulanase